MAGELVKTGTLPALFALTQEAARRYVEFFVANIRNSHPRSCPYAHRRRVHGVAQRSGRPK